MLPNVNVYNEGDYIVGAYKLSHFQAVEGSLV
jgi:hypothetical protein